MSTGEISEHDQAIVLASTAAAKVVGILEGRGVDRMAMDWAAKFAHDAVIEMGQEAPLATALGCLRAAMALIDHDQLRRHAR